MKTPRKYRQWRRKSGWPPLVGLLALLALLMQQTAAGFAEPTSDPQELQAPAPASPAIQQGAVPPGLQIVIIEGEDVSNNIKERTAREPIIQVQDENHKPVAGAVVLFAIDNGGGSAGGSFANGAASFTTQTDSAGRAVARGFHPNSSTGQFKITVDASKGDRKAHTVISQQNVIVGTAAASSGGFLGFLSSHVLLTSIIVAGVVTAITVTAVNQSGPNSTSISTGTGTVGPPQAGFQISLGRHH